MATFVIEQQDPTATALANATPVTVATIQAMNRSEIHITIKNTHASNALYWKLQRLVGAGASQITDVEEPVVGAESPTADSSGYNQLAYGQITTWRVSGTRPDFIRLIAKAANGAASQITWAYKSIA